MSEPLDPAAFRTAVAAWLKANTPRELPDAADERHEALVEWQRQLYAAGWLGYGWAAEYGGAGGSAVERAILGEELALAQAPPPANEVGLEVVGPTLMRFGSDGQRRRFIPPLLSGDEIWCQCFSEPGAGSDLAALATRARPASDGGFVVSGQKVWISQAQFADWGALLARTDPEAPRHKGISYLLVYMRSPGITVRPIQQITGDDKFCEVFFDDVVVPRDQLVGEENNGWHVAMSTLSNERAPYALRRLAEFRVALDALLLEVSEVERDGRRLLDQPSTRERLAWGVAMIDVLESQCRDIARRMATGDLGYETSIDKLLLTEAEQALFGAALDLLGDERTVLRSGPGELNHARWLHDYLYGRAASIYGGSTEIQHNIVAERILKMPRG